MELKDRIIEISDEILNKLLEFKKDNSDFTFSLRTRDSSTSGEERLSKGQWFQGSDYIFVPLFNRGDNKRRIKTIGFVLNFDKKTNDIEENYIEISFKSDDFSKSEIDFHTELADYLNIELSNINVGQYYYDNPNDYLSNLDHYLNVFRPKALELLEEHNINSGFTISEKKFQKSLETITKFKSIINPIGDLEMINRLQDLLFSKKQIIMQGPPGTGKTYTAKDIAEYMISNSISSDKKEQKLKLEESDQFALVQFHPSYSYEDFVRSIAAKSEGGSVVYETENKILANFAEKAMENLNAVNKDVEEFTKEQQIESILSEFIEKVQQEIDEEGSYSITQAVSIVAIENDAFRYTGNWKVSQRMKFSDLILAQKNNVVTRQELKQLKNASGLAKQHSSYFIKVLNDFQSTFENELNDTVNEVLEKPKLKKFILVIDEINRANLSTVLGELIYALEYRNESVQGMYAIDGDNSITLPENLYIIGTMNTADRSVGHIDYAIKRRFAFVDVLPNEVFIKHEKAKQLFKEVASLFVKEEDDKKSNSDFLAPDFDYKDVQLGHSYFILSDNITEEEQKAELEMRLQYEIIPILNDYVRDGLLLETAKDKITEIANFEC